MYIIVGYIFDFFTNISVSVKNEVKINVDLKNDTEVNDPSTTIPPHVNFHNSHLNTEEDPIFTYNSYVLKIESSFLTETFQIILSN